MNKKIRPDDIHQKYSDEMIKWLKERGHIVNDFEKIVGNRKIKRPDIFVFGNNLMIEVKTIQANEKQVVETGEINDKLQNQKEATYWGNNLFNRISEDIRSARTKFKNFFGCKTAIIFIDLLSNFHRQEPELLLKGYLTYLIDTKKAQVSNVIRKNRILRADKNQEIGAIIFAKQNTRNAFRVFHNMSAKREKKLDKNFFNEPSDENFEYYDDYVNPLIKKIN